MRIAAVYIPEGNLAQIFGANHEELTINFGGVNIYTVKNGAIAEVVPNKYFIDDILDPKIALFSCIVGGNGGGKTTLLRTLVYANHCNYVIENTDGSYNLKRNIDNIHRVYFTPYLNNNILENVGNNGKDLSKVALLKMDNHGNSSLLEDFLEAHYSENSKRWIKFNHFYRQLQLANISIPVFERVELVLQHFEPNIHNTYKFHNTPSQLRGAISLLLEKIKAEQKVKEIKLLEGIEAKEFHNVDMHYPLRFEYDLYETALGKLTTILEGVGNTYLEEGFLPEDYAANIEPLNVRDAFEWFLRNAGVYSGTEQYHFNQHLNLLDLIDYVRSLAVNDNITDNWRKLIIHESQALRVVELYDAFNNSFANDWFSFNTDPMFGFLPIILVSSGEQQFLNLYSVLFYHAQNIRLGIDIDLHSSDSLGYIENDILLLLDEGDNAFHPQWKKEYVKNLRAIIPLIFEGFNIQIIITSHDPLTLSDIPKNNVVFLERGQNGTVISSSVEKRTFGANISDLLKDTFFLEDGLMGNFVAGVLDRIIHKMQERSLTDQEIREIERIISTLDEPIIKFKLAEMLHNATGNDTFERQLLDSEIARLQQRRNQI